MSPAAPASELMLATAADEATIESTLRLNSDDWQFEQKFDGYRVVAVSIDGSVTLRTRNGINCTKAYPEIVEALSDQPYDEFVVDGEIVAFDIDGRPSFELMQQRPVGTVATDADRAAVPLTFVAFDLLTLDGVDVRPISLVRRQALLADALEYDDVLLRSDVLEGDARALLEQACADGWEGLIAKRKESPYRGGRSRNWLKLKCLRSDDFVIVGFTEPSGRRSGFGALLLATRERGEWVFAGRVGTGFDDALLRSLRAELDLRPADRPPFERPGGVVRPRWVRPELVCTVGYTEATAAGQLRHPRFLGLRPDKNAAEVAREPVADRVELSNTDKIFFPAIEGTKGEMLAYYELVAPTMLRHVANRPLVLERFPDGVTTKGFYQKNTPDHTPPFIRRLPVGSRSRGQITYSVIDDVNGLLWLANQAAMVIHTLLSGADDPLRPIEMIFDLDPSTSDLKPVQEAARRLKARLDGLGLSPRVKTTGSKGLHLHVDVTDDPAAGISFETTRAFAERLALELVHDAPDLFTLEFAKKARGSRLLIDVLRNGHASHAVAPYSVRAVPEASVAAPLSWDEALSSDFHPRAHTIRTMAARLADGIDPWADHPPPTSTIAEAAARLLAGEAS